MDLEKGFVSKSFGCNYSAWHFAIRQSNWHQQHTRNTSLHLLYAKCLSLCTDASAETSSQVHLSGIAVPLFRDKTSYFLYTEAKTPKHGKTSTRAVRLYCTSVT